MPESATPPTVPVPRVHAGVAAGVSPLDSFCWPTPPYAAYPAGEPWSQPKACEVVGLNGAVRACQLVALDPFDRVAHIQVPPSRVTMPLRFSQFQRIVIDELLVPQALGGEDEALFDHRPAVEYRVVMADGTEHKGQTVGHIEANYGLFLFHPTSGDGAVRRVFLARDAYRSIEVGPQVLDVLLKDQLVTEQQVAQATEEQQALRSRKLGEVLVQQKIVSADQLMLAIEQQARMPMVRLGEALTALGLVTPEQLREALAQQQAERNLSVGELLMRDGRLSGDDLQAALARKMGYPLVDVDTFPIEHRAIQRMPAAMARRLNVLPLVMRDGRLMVAMEDPTRRAVIEELELVTNTKVAPVLASGPRITRRLPELYAELRSEAAALGAQLADSAARAGPAAPRRDLSLLREVGMLLHEALTHNASAVHLESQGELMQARLRVDGRLLPHGPLAGLAPEALVQQLRELQQGASASGAVHSGWLDMTPWPGLLIDGLAGVRATVIDLQEPQVVLQLVRSTPEATLAELGLSDPTLRLLAGALQEPRGLVLLACPEPAAGTQLRRAVAQQLLAVPRKTWLTLQGLELPLPGALSVPGDGADADALARTVLQLAQADADALVIGDITALPRGQWLAHAALQAARQSALLVVSVSADDEAQAIERLLAMGVAGHDLAACLQLVLVHRPMVRLCPHCRSTRAPKPEERATLDALRARLGEPVPAEPPADLVHESRGCGQCAGSGLLGLTGVQAATVPDADLRQAIRQAPRNPAPGVLGAAVARVHNARGLAQDGLLKAGQGLVSPVQLRALIEP